MIYWVPKCAGHCAYLGAWLSHSKVHLSMGASVLHLEPEDLGSRQSHVTQEGHFHSLDLNSSSGK